MIRPEVRSPLVIAVFACALAAAPLCGQKPNKPPKNAPKPGKETAGVILGEAGAALDAFMKESRWGAEGFSGCALVAVGNDVLLEQGYGVFDADKKIPMPPDAMWDWASVTKQFTAAAILKLETQKKIAVGDALSKVCKDAPKDKAKVTIRHLLDHTSGIKYDAGFDGISPFERDAVVAHILKLPMVSEPGEKWAYSNIAYFLLGAVIEKVSGRTYEDYLIENLFRPAGMKTACFIGSPCLDMDKVPREERGTGVKFAYGDRLSWGYRGAGGAVASVREMYLWDRALRRTGKDAILPPKAVERMYVPDLENYGLGWFIDKNTGTQRVYHSGSVGKLVTWYLRDLEKDAVVALAYNCNPPFHPQTAANELMALALRKAK